MSNRTKFILIIVGGFIAIGFLLYWFWPRGTDTIVPAEDQLPAKIQLTPEQQNAVKLPQPTAAEIDSDSALRTARTFTERFATFSNTNGYIDLSALFTMCTPEMNDWLRNEYLPKLKKDFPANGFYYSVSTMAPSAAIATQKGESMQVTVSTQRQETKADKQGESFIQKINIDMKKADGKWLVDGAYWQKI
jgi:hypothetical protein